MDQVYIKDDYIKLEQAMKLSGAISSGSDAKYEIKDGAVSVNGAVEYARGKKLRIGDRFTYKDYDYQICRAEKL